jgi:D-alanyl-D-alanine carboxypeptidase
VITNSFHRFALALVFASLCARGATGQAHRPYLTNDQIKIRLQQDLSKEIAADKSLPGEILHVDVPTLRLNIDEAAGVLDRTSRKPLGPADVFRVASVTKTFVAASILRLFEEGKIRLDDPIKTYLPREYQDVLASGGYDIARITVQHLLTHTSGIHDYAQDQKYYEAVFAAPKHRWTRMEQVQAATKWGKPHFSPGAGYHYSDTGYILLGEVVEKLTGKPLGIAFRDLLGFRQLGLSKTYLESLEPVPSGEPPLSHAYFGDIDTIDFDPSIDLYGGGGLVSSAQDLARFYRALLTNKIFHSPSTLRTMLAIPATNMSAPGGPYALGIQSRVIGGNKCWGHTGFWGTSAFYCPDADVTIVRQYNQAQPRSLIFNDLYMEIANLLGMNSPFRSK